MSRGIGGSAGFYEQCDHRSSERSSASDSGATLGSLVALGLLGRPGRLGHLALRTLAGSDRLSDFDARVVSISDLMCELRLDAAADVIVWYGVDGSRAATPITRLLDTSESSLVIGGRDESARPLWSDPVVLRSPSLPNSGELDVVALTAISFTEFIGGAR